MKEDKQKIILGGCFDPSPSVFTVKVIGVGGGALNILEKFQADSTDALGFIAIDNDEDSLKFTKRVTTYNLKSLLANNIPIDFEYWLSGVRQVSDSIPNNSKVDIEELRQRILDNAVENMRLFSDEQLVIFIVCLGGETGSAIAPVLASICGLEAELTLVFAVTPAEFEAVERHERAKTAVKELEKTADTVFQIPMTDALFSGETGNPSKLFARYDEIVIDAVRAVTESLYSPKGLCCVDFPDLKLLFRTGKKGYVANGCASGKERAWQVLENALGSEN